LKIAQNADTVTLMEGCRMICWIRPQLITLIVRHHFRLCKLMTQCLWQDSTIYTSLLRLAV